MQGQAQVYIISKYNYTEVASSTKVILSSNPPGPQGEGSEGEHGRAAPPQADSHCSAALSGSENFSTLEPTAAVVVPQGDRAAVPQGHEAPTSVAAKQRSQRSAPPVHREAGLQGEQHALAASPRLKQEKIINWVRKRCTSLPARSPPSPARPPPPPVPPSPPPVPAESPLPRAAVAKGTKEPSRPENSPEKLEKINYAVRRRHTPAPSPDPSPPPRVPRGLENIRIILINKMLALLELFLCNLQRPPG